MNRPNLRIVEKSPWNSADAYIDHLRQRRPSTFERISAAIDLRGFLPFYAGTVFGAFLTVALAFVWSAL